MSDYFKRKADILLATPKTMSLDGFRDALIRTLKEVAKDQREACVQAYFDIPEDAEWDPDIVIKNAELT